MNKKIQVTILDDHPTIIDGYRYQLERDPQIEVASAIHYGSELEPSLKQHPTDVLLLDVNVPNSEEDKNPYPILHIIPHILQAYPNIEILIISMHAERGLIRAVMDAGASGYLLKDDQTILKNLASVIKAVTGGGVQFSQAAYESYKKLLSAESGKDPTPRQLEALSLCAAYPNSDSNEIAGKLSVTSSTVRNLLSNAYIKLGVNTRAAAISEARRRGLITPYQPEVDVLSASSKS